MTIYTIDETNNITAFANAQQAAEASTTPFDLFTNQNELAELIAGWPEDRLVATFNSLPGVKPVKKLKDSATAAGRIFERVEKLGQLVTTERETPKAEAAPAKPKTAQKGKGGAQAAKGAPVKGSASKRATPAKAASKGKKAAKVEEVAGPRGGSKTAEVVAMLQRKAGATISEIMNAMHWQRHTVRGFVAGAMKKAGYTVESFKPEGGERTYRINK
jgi:hypothetical protein